MKIELRSPSEGRSRAGRTSHSTAESLAPSLCAAAAPSTTPPLARLCASALGRLGNATPTAAAVDADDMASSSSTAVFLNSK
jgi:hypothetical protein